MPNIQTINTTVYKLLKNDTILAGLCSIYKGAKRPGNTSNPSVTIETKWLKPGSGEGIWICEIVVTAYADIMANRMADHKTFENIVSRVSELLVNTEIEFDGAKAQPLIEKENKGIEWTSTHENETSQEIIFELNIIDFGCI